MSPWISIDGGVVVTEIVGGVYALTLRERGIRAPYAPMADLIELAGQTESDLPIFTLSSIIRSNGGGSRNGDISRFIFR